MNMVKKITPALYAPPHPVAFEVACSLAGLLLGGVLAGLTGLFCVLVICKGQRKQLDLEKDESPVLRYNFPSRPSLVPWAPVESDSALFCWVKDWLLTLATWNRLETLYPAWLYTAMNFHSPFCKKVIREQ